jgi:hypothetical protein
LFFPDRRKVLIVWAVALIFSADFDLKEVHELGWSDSVIVVAAGENLKAWLQAAGISGPFVAVAKGGRLCARRRRQTNRDFHVAARGVARLVGIEGGVVSGVINLESSGVEAPDWRPRHDEHYHEA